METKLKETQTMTVCIQEKVRRPGCSSVFPLSTGSSGTGRGRMYLRPPFPVRATDASPAVNVSALESNLKYNSKPRERPERIRKKPWDSRIIKRKGNAGQAIETASNKTEQKGRGEESSGPEHSRLL